MAFAQVFSRALNGATAPLVRVEVNLANGLPQFNLVGLPDAQVRESRERVRAAFANCHFDFPASRITVNLAPADLPKQSSRFDLPIALGILSASGQLHDRHLSRYEFVGELALTGELRAVHGGLPMAVAAGASGRTFILPQCSAQEAAHAQGTVVLPAAHLLEVCGHLSGEQVMMPQRFMPSVTQPQYPDMADVRGQAPARRALEIAASGGHHLLMVGPPGTGKSMLAARFCGICPPLTEDEALASAALYCASHEAFSAQQWRRRPFRHPHHSCTTVAMMGGGHMVRPGEVSLAHCGILHLDEMAEFSRTVLDMLREPLETGEVCVSRAARKAVFPARFQLVGTMNPCPCGYRGHPSGQCHCSPEQVARLIRRISGPLLDRIDIRLSLPPVAAQDLQRGPTGEPTSTIQARVIMAHQRQRDRQGKPNARLNPGELDQWAALTSAGQILLMQAAERFQLSARGVHRVLRVARTVADLGGHEQIHSEALAEALHYRGASFIQPSYGQ